LKVVIINGGCEMKKMSIQEVGVASLGKLIGTVHAAIGIVVGSIMGVVTAVGVISNNDYSVIADLLVAVGIMLAGVVIYPALLFIGGWLYGALIALIFNLVLGASGGLELKVQDVKETK
jgi:hypothetical protein